MLDRLWTFLAGRRPSPEKVRRRLLRRYPRHLDLIDSCRIPHEYSKGPDLSYLTESAEYYYNLIVESAPHLKDKSRAVTDADRATGAVANSRIVYATWGLIARGADAIPFVVRLIRSSDVDEREAGANVFCGMRDPGRVTQIVGEMAAALAKEQDRLVIDTLVGALGHLGSREALPAIARVLMNPSEDSDTRFTAADSLGRIIKRKFGKNGADAVQEACAWLRSQGYHEP